jgi:hypothetical protein
VAILVDDAMWPWRGRRWAHLVSDESYDELHAFAARLGLPPRSFQGDHYDVPAEVRLAAVGLGAAPVDARELLRRLKGSGLRLSPRQRRQLGGQVAAGRGVEGVVGPVRGVDAVPPEEAPHDR